MTTKDTPPHVRPRGQTTPDFVIGISVFLVTIAFIVAFIPQMLVPYQDQDHAAVTERVAGTLTGTLLGSVESESASVLNESCTVAFLTQTDGTGCPFNTTTALTTQVGIESHYAVNVTLKRDVAGGPAPDILCANDGAIGTCGTDRLAVGPSVPTDSRSVATTQRTVFINGTDATLEVTVW